MVSWWKQKKIFLFFFLLITIIGLLAGLYLVHQRQVVQKRAIGEPMVMASRGVEGDLRADIIIGQPDFSEITPNTTVSRQAYLPHGVIVDRTSSPNKMYVYDAGNNRILGFNWDKCLASTTNPANCSADIVIGQPSMSTSACNGDSGFQDFPNRAPASASSLCGEEEATLSISEGGSGASMAVDSQGNLYVFDAFNHRVLKYIRPFETDTVADDVWGQDNFTENKPNKGMSSPDATSLSYGWGRCNAWTAGVDIDPSGNLWVTDNQNNRVLRFPPGSKQADLVLGQPNFTSKSRGSALSQFDGPTVVRVSSKSWVYVADQCNNRVLVFKPPFSNGMSGSIFGSGFKGPAGIDLDPTEPNRLWIANSHHQVIELWNENNPSGPEKTVGQRGNGNLLGDATGSVGIDSSGNLLIAIGVGNYDNDVLFFSKQDILTGQATSRPTKRIFGWGGANGNLKTGTSLGMGNGVVIADNQLIVADHERLMFWNNPSTLINGKPANGVAGYNVVTGKGVSSFTDPSDRAHGCCLVLKADKSHHLWVSVGLAGDSPQRIELYQLPLTNGAQPIKTINFPLQTIDGQQIQLLQEYTYQHITGLAPTDNSHFLWVSHANTNRVFRIRNPLSSPVVDVVLGQTDPNGTQCNRGAPNVSGAGPNTLCHPGALSFDRFGNLYVSDHWLEIYGNYRLLVFNKGLFPTDNTQVIYAPSASKIFPNIATWEPAFDSHNRMVIGYNPWYGKPNGGWFPGIYYDPLSSSTTPDAFCNDYYSMALSATFDDNDNLYIGDHNRARVLIYKKPLASIPSHTPTPTPSPAPSLIPTMTPPASPTPTTDGVRTVQDPDGNIYHLVQIGSQTWLKENLRYDGDPNGNGCKNVIWENYKDKGWCGYYPGASQEEGLLYQWSAAMNGSRLEGAQGLCPIGCHVPTDADWHTLEAEFATGSCDANRTAPNHWACSPAGTALKKGGWSGFESLLVGQRSYADGAYYQRGEIEVYWTSTESGIENTVWTRVLYVSDPVYKTDDSRISRSRTVKTFGFPVRCICDGGVPSPTVTPMPTPTCEPGKAALNFFVKFEGIDQYRPNPGLKVTLKQGGTVVATFENVAANIYYEGIYSAWAVNITPGTYDILIKGWAHLQKKFAGITLNEGNNSQNWSNIELKTGDADNNNEINIQDLGVLARDYRQTDSPADFNLDGIVNIQDFRYIAINYRAQGDN